MKKFIQYSFILGLLVALPLSFASAQATVATTTPDKPVVKEADPVDTLALKNQPLSVRKAKVETDLKALISQLGVFYTRTQTAVDRLAEKDIDVSAAQDELDLANTSLSDAKTNINLFSKVVILETKQDKAASELKNYAKKTEDALRVARLHLINALTLLKDAINNSVASDTTQ